MITLSTFEAEILNFISRMGRGYIKRQQGRDAKGKMTAIEYTIYEQPQPPDDTPPGLDNPTLENPTPG